MKIGNETKTQKPRLVMWGFIGLAALWWVSIIIGRRLDKYDIFMAIADTLLAVGFVIVVRRK